MSAPHLIENLIEPMIALTVNGTSHELDCAPHERLADVLRDRLGLTGTKIGCNAGDCGACTVLIDGHQACACITAVGQAAGRSVTTVEGLSVDEALNPLQRAFLAHGAAQCGICTPGMLMAATDLLARNPRPTQADVAVALAGVLCRCTGYQKIIEAVMAAAAGNTDVPITMSGHAVGARAVKTDGPAKLRGVENFGADRAPDDALWLRAVRSPHDHARFTLGDFSTLKRAYPGLVDLITAADVPENSFGIFPDVKDQPIFAADLVRFRGEAVVGLVGDRATVERITDSEIPIVYTPLPALRTIEAALAADALPVHANAADNVLVRGRVLRGAPATALTQAAYVATGEFTTSYVEHAYIEPEAGYAERISTLQSAAPGDRLHVFASTQTPYMDRDELARVLMLKPEQVRIEPSAVGGGFGGKLDIAIQPLLAVAAWKLRRPVRGVFTRPESMIATTKRHPALMRVQMACDALGYITALDFAGDFNTGAYASWGNTVANRVPIHASGPYFVPNVQALTRAVYAHAPIAGAFRGFGVPQSTIAHEALLDDLAAAAGIDRLEIRYRNALRAGQTTATGQRLDASCGLAQCIEALRPYWHAGLQVAAAFNALNAVRKRGIGIACMWYGCGNTVIANPSTLRASLRTTGRIMFYNGAVDIGQGSNTMLMQVLADAIGIDMTSIDFIMGDTDFTADAGKTSASRQAFVSGNAAKRAGEALRKRMLQLIEAAPDAQLRLDGRWLIANDRDVEKRLDLSELPGEPNGDLLVGEGTFNPPTVPLDANGQGVPYATYAFAAQLAEVEVDVALGTTKVLRIVAAHDVGRALNPTQVEGQVHGGIAQGLGLALMEEYQSGKTDNLHDYLIPTIGDMPQMEVLLIEDAEPLGAHGAKGVGEPALIATAPAIFSAIRHATGVRVTHAPCTPDRLRSLIAARGAQA